MWLFSPSIRKWDDAPSNPISQQLKATSDADMADRNASPSFSQPRKPPDDVIQGAASQMVLNAALRRQDYNATHPTARPDAANSPRPEAMNVPDAGQMKSRTSRSEAQKSTGLASRTDVKPPRPPLQKLDSARVDTRVSSLFYIFYFIFCNE